MGLRFGTTLDLERQHGRRLRNFKNMPAVCLILFPNDLLIGLIKSKLMLHVFV